MSYHASLSQRPPIDTWIKQAVDQHYPHLHADDYHAIGENVRQHFSPHVGYAQEYVFHHVRNQENK